jgi:hypothetical protein
VTRKLDQCRLSREERNRIKSAIAKKIGGKVPTRWIPMNVMAPTMQVACKAFIVPNPAARSPKERYTHVPRSLRRVRHARCFSGQCPSEATNKIGMRHIYWSCCQNARATQGGWLHHQKKVVEKLAQAGHETNIAKPVLQAGPFLQPPGFFIVSTIVSRCSSNASRPLSIRRCRDLFGRYASCPRGRASERRHRCDIRSSQ